MYANDQFDRCDTYQKTPLVSQYLTVVEDAVPNPHGYHTHHTVRTVSFQN